MRLKTGLQIIDYNVLRTMERRAYLGQPRLQVEIETRLGQRVAVVSVADLKHILRTHPTTSNNIILINTCIRRVRFVYLGTRESMSSRR